MRSFICRWGLEPPSLRHEPEESIESVEYLALSGAGRNYRVNLSYAFSARHASTFLAEAFIASGSRPSSGSSGSAGNDTQRRPLGAVRSSPDIGSNGLSGFGPRATHALR